MNKNHILIILYSLGAAALLYFIEQSIGVSYVLKTLLKILLFLIVPFIYTHLFLGKGEGSRIIKTRGLWPGIALGIFSFVAVIVAYAVLAQYIDLSNIVDELQTKLGITPLNFIFVALYITLVNSLLEEYFFRNFIFLRVFNEGKIWVAYVYSSLLFALYHMAIFAQWFTPSLTLLCLLGLFLVGLVYCYINSKAENFFNSWIAHVFADSAIILIGLRMFELI